ncbi:MAG: Lrp/AsnC family transcriptional regulator, partial [Candidatus Nitrosotenuis sp.]|nr:Lrp/AsnC family transcriptional regulator [Candidatus Nitrosotenuis sp.]
MDALDREILNEIQWSFPLVKEPYNELASRFKISPDEMKKRISALKSSGVLRQLSAIFDTRRLGYKSSLVAMAVTPDRLEAVANLINRHPGVSHNYERNHEYNLWFTLATPPGSDLKTEVDKFSKLPGILKVRLLPTIKLFKIGVKLEMIEDKKQEIAPTEEKKKIKDVKFEPTEDDKEFIRQLQKDLDVVDRPFLAAAQSLGMSEEQVFEKLRYYEEIGVMRRYAAILRHRDAGFTANGMIVWRVPEEKIEEVGA